MSAGAGGKMSPDFAIEVSPVQISRPPLGNNGQILRLGYAAHDYRGHTNNRVVTAAFNSDGTLTASTPRSEQDPQVLAYFVPAEHARAQIIRRDEAEKIRLERMAQALYALRGFTQD